MRSLPPLPARLDISKARRRQETLEQEGAHADAALVAQEILELEAAILLAHNLQKAGDCEVIVAFKTLTNGGHQVPTSIKRQLVAKRAKRILEGGASVDPAFVDSFIKCVRPWSSAGDLDGFDATKPILSTVKAMEGDGTDDQADMSFSFAKCFLNDALVWYIHNKPDAVVSIAKSFLKAWAKADIVQLSSGVADVLEAILAVCRAIIIVSEPEPALDGSPNDVDMMSGSSQVLQALPKIVRGFFLASGSAFKMSWKQQLVSYQQVAAVEEKAKDPFKAAVAELQGDSVELGPACAEALRLLPSWRSNLRPGATVKIEDLLRKRFLACAKQYLQKADSDAQTGHNLRESGLILNQSHNDDVEEMILQLQNKLLALDRLSRQGDLQSSIQSFLQFEADVPDLQAAADSAKKVVPLLPSMPPSDVEDVTKKLAKHAQLLMEAGARSILDSFSEKTAKQIKDFVDLLERLHEKCALGAILEAVDVAKVSARLSRAVANRGGSRGVENLHAAIVACHALGPLATAAAAAAASAVPLQTHLRAAEDKLRNLAGTMHAKVKASCLKASADLRAIARGSTDEKSWKEGLSVTASSKDAIAHSSRTIEVEGPTLLARLNAVKQAGPRYIHILSLSAGVFHIGSLVVNHSFFTVFTCVFVALSGEFGLVLEPFFP